MKTLGDDGADGVLRAFCERHMPEHMLESHQYKLETLRLTKTKKSTRAYDKTYVPTAPLLPAVILKSVVEYVGKVRIQNKAQAVEKLGHYWSLKREARRGAPLLKRLHLEVSRHSTPFPAISGSYLSLLAQYLLSLGPPQPSLALTPKRRSSRRRRSVSSACPASSYLVVG